MSIKKFILINPIFLKKKSEKVREVCSKIIKKTKENEYIWTRLIYLVKSSTKKKQRIYLLELLDINNEQWIG